jgi:hypothetical protein
MNHTNEKDIIDALKREIESLKHKVCELKNNIPEGITTECRYHISNLKSKIRRLQFEFDMFNTLLQTSNTLSINPDARYLANSDVLFGLLMHYRHFHSDRCSHDVAVRILDEKNFTYINNFEQVYKQIYDPKQIQSYLHKTIVETPVSEII